MSSVVPEGWESLPLGKFLKFRRGTSYVASELSEDAYNHPLYITMKSFKVGGGYSVRGDKYYSPSYERKQAVEQDEILLANTDVTSSCDILGAPLLLPREKLRAEVLFSHHVTAAKILENVDKDFLFYLLSSPSVRQVVQSCGRGTTVKMLDMKDMGKLSFSLPPLPEQKKIASILTSVDEVIENTQKQIDKLQDLKKATMNELLTKGIGHTEFKDSELGRIPKSWEVKKLKDIGDCIRGLTYSPDDIAETGLLVLRSSNIQHGRIYLGDNVFVNLDVTRKFRTQVGDLLICVRNGSRRLLGKSAIIPEGLPPSTHGAFMTVFRTPLNEYVQFLLQSEWFFTQVSRDIGATINSINNSNLLEYLFAFPTHHEQTQITNQLKSIESLIVRKSNKLSQTQSLKKSLMQDLLTGKVRVTVN